MRSVMQHNFTQVPGPKIERSSFDRSHGLKTCFNGGDLVPIFWDMAYPGDTFSLHMNGFARLATPTKPFMDNLTMTTFFFSVPIRHIWEHWKEFCGEQPDPDPDFSNPEYHIPQMQGPDHAAGGIPIGSLSDYLGLPTGPLSEDNTGIMFNSWFHRCYAWIWNSWFRDENLQNRTHLDTDDGPDLITDYPLLKRGKRKDYFTGCLPFPQKGPDVLLPLGDTAPVLGQGEMYYSLYSKDHPSYDPQIKGTESMIVGGNVLHQRTGTPGDYFVYPGSEPTTGMYADLTEATAVTINALRQAWQVQRLYERDARGGTRYYELLKAHFGVVDPGALIQQLPLYLGGGTTPVNIHPIAQTSASPDTPTRDDAQGNLAAFGTSSVHGHGFKASFTEHCLILGLVSVQADLTYQTGLEKLFSIRSRNELYWPAFAHLGEQAVLSKEIYCDGSEDDENVFGYQERYAELRYKQSRITNLMRSSAPDSLDVWHLSQDFGTNRPELNDYFIQDRPPIERVVAVTTEPQFILDVFFNYKCVRPMPVFSVPGLVDHF